MRLIGTLENERDGKRFAAFLASRGIGSQCEWLMNSDWGSDAYGTPLCKIWVVEEDQVAEAQKLFDQYQQDPENAQFDVTMPLPPEPNGEELPVQEAQMTPPSIRRATSSIRRARLAFGPLTFYLMLVCGWLFIWGMTSKPQVESIPVYLPATPLLSPPVNKLLMFDYPQAFSIVDRLVNLYGVEALKNPEDLPKEGQFLILQFFRTPYWQGLYEAALSYWKNPEQGWIFDAPLFEKIREGEFWRFFTPCLLHHDIFHLLFNMIWLVVLGRQLEARLSAWKYVFFILLTGAISNTAQYLMGGSNFIGISGVLCAMLTFIWMRQRYAGWEGYDLQRATFALMMVFIVAVALIQVGLFFSEAALDQPLSSGIANTAHLSGAAIGFVLGRMNFFSWKAG